VNSDKHALIESLGAGWTLIRGTGLPLQQFTAWALFDPAGYRIPDEKLPIAKQALTAAGYAIGTYTAGSSRAAVGGNHHTARDWPECAAIIGHDTSGKPIECRAPFLERREPEPGEHCTSCGQELVLRDPGSRDREAERAAAKCPACGRRTPHGASFCRCGQPLHEAGASPRQVLTIVRPELFTLPTDPDEDEP
jgi:hypothetical protein